MAQGRKKNTAPPAQGEEVALRGYTSQYLVAAELILRALHNKDFEAVVLKDFKAEKVDDVQILSKRQVDAYQVKWHTPTTSLTPGSLTGPAGNPEKGFLRQLADGWKALSNIYAAKDVFVHLYTTSTPSTTTVKGIANSAPPPRHLAEFFRVCWEPDTVGHDALQKWQPFILKLQTASGLSTVEFEKFRVHCAFDLNRRRPQDREEYDPAARHYKDAEHLQSQLLKTAGQQQGTITLSRKEILELTGWSARFEFKAPHEFPVTKHYVPIESTAQHLEEAIQTYNHGYLALLGSPGSGKSTLLTKALRYRPKVRVLRYYCFVPDDSALSRGEAFNFLHDLVLTIWNEGVRPAGHAMGETIEQLRITFQAQMQEIGNLWKEKGIRTILLVDGLDHIRRESNPERSLLKEFPLPSAIPEGCVFVLGSQRVENIELNTRIIQHLRTDNSARTITMGQLSRRAIREIASMRLPDASFSEEDLETIEARSAGHPLALNYVLNRLQNTGPQDTGQILAELPEYADTIEEEYEIYWRQLQDDTELRELLALLSRMRGVLDINLAHSLASDATVRRLVSSAKHYFLELPNLRWKFFHNSFRQFILDKTGRNAFEIADDNAHRGYHEKLTQLAKLDTTPTVFRWDELYHTYHAGDLGDVLAIATQAFFREQFLASRPVHFILEDTTLVMRAAKECGDIIAAIRVLLVESELNARADILDETNLPSLLLGVGKRDEAVKHILHEDRLLIDPARALDFASDLASAGYVELGKEIFEAAEPLEKLSGLESGGVTRHGRDVLEAWVDAAARFRSLEEIKGVINGLNARESDDFYGEVTDATRNLRQRLLIQLTDAVIDKGVRSEIEELPALLRDSVDETALRQRIAYRVIGSEFDPVWKEEKLNWLLRQNAKNPLPDYIVLRMASVLLKEKSDARAASALFDRLQTPKRIIDDDTRDRSINSYVRRLRYYRLKSALGYTTEPTEAVPDAVQDHDRAIVLIERMVIRMANIWGKAWQGNAWSPATVLNELTPAIRLAERRGDHELRLAFSGMLEGFLEVVIYTAAAHGDQALLALEEFFEQRWNDDSTSKSWPYSIRRSASLSLFRAGGSRDNLVARLKRLDPILSAQEDVREFLDSCEEQARAWIETGDIDRAHDYIDPMIRSSFGLYHEKDSQVYDWTNWFVTILKNNPSVAERDFQIVAQGIATAAAYSRGSRASDAAVALLAAIAAYDSDTADKLKHFFWDEGVLDFPSTMEAFLLAGFRDEQVSIEIPLVALRRMYLPYVRYFEEELIEALVARFAKFDSDPYAEKLLDELMVTVEREVSPQLCGKWWAVLDQNLRRYPQAKHLLDPVIKRLSKQKPESHHTKGKITLLDGTVIEEDDLLEQAKSPERLVYILENVQDDHFFSWWSVINYILADLDKVQTDRSFRALAALRKGGRDISGLIGRLHELKSTRSAEQYAIKALQESESTGWSHYYDGGSRIEPYKILVKIDEKYHEQAFEQFVDDYLQGYRPYYLTSILGDFVSVFWSTAPFEALWSEFFEHFSQLREFTRPAISLPKDLNLRRGDSDGATQLLIKNAFEAFAMPQPELRKDSYKALIELYNNVPQIRSQVAIGVENYLDSERELPLLGLTLIHGLANTAPDLVDKFREKIRRFLDHDDMAFRLAARKILSYCEPSPPIKRDRPLPSMYAMELPDFETMADGLSSALFNPGTVLPDTHDTLQLVGVAQEALEIIHRSTGIAFRNLVERTAMLMGTVLPAEEWNSEAEKALQARCKYLGLETSYRRPRSLAAFMALGYLIAELYDSERLADNDLHLLRPCLSLFDSKLSEMEPNGRNFSPIDITVSDDYRARDRNWLEAQPTPVYSPPSVDQGWTILGFVTKAEVPSWERPFEYTSGSICPPQLSKADINDNPESIIPGTMMSIWWMAEQYPGLPYVKSALKRSLLIRGTPQRVEIGGTSWLALNPIIATKLGWSYSNEGLFRWTNADGDVVVESQWWQAGRMKRHAPATGVRAEGWVVKASPSGFEELRRTILPAAWAHGVKKTSTINGEQKEKSWTWINSIN